jgi:hypothetical protein
VINVVVRELDSLERFLAGGLEGAEEGPGAGVRHLHRPPPGGRPEAEEPGGEEVASSMRAAGPSVQSFGMGRRR